MGAVLCSNRHIKEMLWEFKIREKGDVYEAYVANVVVKVVCEKGPDL